MGKNKRRPKKEKYSVKKHGFVAGLALGLCSTFALALVGAGSASIPPSPPPKASSPAAAEPEAPRTSRETTILAVGDMIFSRRVAERLPEDGWAGPFERARPLFESADLVFGNLETTAAFRGEPFPGKHPAITFRAPPGILFGLKQAGFSALSLANNHINDFGPVAIAETIAALDMVGIAHSGAGRNDAEARRPAIVRANGKRFAFLAYTEKSWSVLRADSGAGAAVLEEPTVIADIETARKNADFVIVSIHWGEELQGAPRETDRQLARRILDAGADAIIGHHPHVLQGAEFYKGKPILYSLGNFIFDMISSRTYESAAAVLRFGDEGVRGVLFIPLRIDAGTFAPAPAKGEDAAAIGDLLTDRCRAVGGRLEPLAEGIYQLRPPGAYRTTASREDSSSSEYGFGMTPLNP